MDIKEFAREFIDNVKMSVEMTGNDYDQELATSILEYIEDNGEVNAPEICSFQKTRTRITAYDYNDEAESLDLFYLMKADTILGRINNGKVQQGFNYLMAFYREAMNGQLFKNQEIAPSDEIVEVAKLVQSTKGQIKPSPQPLRVRTKNTSLSVMCGTCSVSISSTTSEPERRKWR